MLSGDFIAERLRPDVCKIVLALDAADLQPVRFDFILQAQMRHVDVSHCADSMSMFCCCASMINTGSTAKTQVSHHALDAFRF